jgi:aspartyl protease family protein
MGFNNFNDGDWQSFSYLLILLTVLLGSLFSRRDLPFRKVFKYLGIWSVLGLIIIVLYSYRFEFSDFKTRILGEINPSWAQTNKDGKIEVKLAQDGHFYIDAEINNIPARFMIDTGASDIVISVKEAKRIGINTKKLSFNKPYQTANGTSWGASIKFDKLKVGSAVFSDVNASVNNADMGTSLLGMSFLRRFKKYEFYQDRLILEL